MMLLPKTKIFSNDASLFLSPKKSSSTTTEHPKQIEDEISTEKKNNNEKTTTDEISFIVDIDIGQPEDVPLIIFKNQSFKNAATIFCKENNLDPELIEILEAKIENQKRILDSSINGVKSIRKVEDSQFVSGNDYNNSVSSKKNSGFNLLFQSPEKNGLKKY
jgi:hypothetical protein